MQIKWSARFSEHEEDIWMPEYVGLFMTWKGNARFYFKNRQKLGCTMLSTYGIISEKFYYPQKTLNLPYDWVFEKKLGILICSEECGIMPEDGQELQFLPQDAKEYYADHHEHTITGKSFSFGDFTVTHNGRFSVTCYRNNEELWKVPCHGYLYTEIRCYQNHLYWGTDGSGGRFYVVNLLTGTIIAEVNTGGTNQIIEKHNTVLIFQRGKQHKLLKVSLESGKIEDSIDLPGNATKYSRMFAHDDGIYLTTFRSKNNKIISPIMSFVELE